jgi:hypothetical protein
MIATPIGLPLGVPPEFSPGRAGERRASGPPFIYFEPVLFRFACH